MDIKYDLDDCIEWINGNGYKRVSLQFKDEDVSDSVEVTQFLENSTRDVDYYVVLTASCGVDYLAPLRLGSSDDTRIQAVISFGGPCLSEAVYNSLPTLFVFPRYFPGFVDTVRRDLEYGSKGHMSLVLYDLKYTNLIRDSMGGSDLSHVEFAKINAIDDKWSFTTDSQPLIHRNVSTDDNIFGRFVTLHPIESYKYIRWIGSCSELFYQINCPHGVEVINPDHQTISRFDLHPERALMKRMAVIEKAKAASIIGLVLTNSLPSVDSIMTRIKRLSEQKKKQLILISLIQSVDNTKFGNFPEVQVFVLSSSCSCGHLIQTIETHAPLLTLEEYEISLGKRITYGNVEWNADSDANDVTEVDDENTPNTRMDIMEYDTQNKDKWFGLQVMPGEHPVAQVTVGSSGVASSYNTEPAVE